MAQFPQNHTVDFYQERNGNFPFLEWLEALDLSTQVRINNRLIRIEVGNFGDCKSVGNSVFEFRLDFGPGYRIYYGQAENRLLLLLLGGSKRTQKRDIAKAKEYWQDYLERRKHEKKD